MKCPSKRTLTIGALGFVAAIAAAFAIGYGACDSTESAEQRGFLGTGGQHLPGTSNTLPKLTNLGASYEKGVQTTTSTGTQNDFVLGTTTSRLRTDNASALTLTGFKCGAANCAAIDDGRKLRVCAVNGDVTLSHATTSAAANQILGDFGQSLRLFPSATNACVDLEYDGASTKWRQVGSGIRLSVVGSSGVVLKFSSQNQVAPSQLTDDGNNLSWTGGAFGASTAGDKAFNFGHDTSAATDNENGWRVRRHSDGNIYQDTKTFTAGTINYRGGAGAESGAARTWMTVTPSTAAVSLPGNVTNGNADADKTTIWGHAQVEGSVPTVSSCGTGSGTPVGSSAAFRALSGNTTTCTWTFARTYTQTPVCVGRGEGTATIPTCTVSATAITCTVLIAATTYHWVCLGVTGGT